jgi:hypothetical protein
MDGFAPACPPTQEELRLPLSPVQDNILASAEAALPPPLALPEALKGQSAEASPPAPEPEAESPAGAGLSMSSSNGEQPCRSHSRWRCLQCLRTASVDA